jgi:hypothetical protein
MQPKLIVTFDRLAEGDFFAKAELINSSMTANANFPLPWPAMIPTPAQLNTAFALYQTDYNAAMSKDTGKIALRDAARAALTVILKKIAPYLEMVAGGSVMILQTTGYDLWQDAAHIGGSGDVPAPANFKIARGAMSGTVAASATPVPGAGSYLLQSTTGDPTLPGSWSGGQVFMHCTHMELTGQTPGAKLCLRLCAVGPNGQGPWTDAMMIYVG